MRRPGCRAGFDDNENCNGMAYNPKCLENLKNGFRTKEAAQSAAMKSIEARRRRKSAEEMADKFLDDLSRMAFGKSTLDDFRKLANDAPNQALRVMALSLCTPRTAAATMQWLLERIKGKPKMQIDQKVDAGDGVTIVVRSQDEREKIESIGELGV